MPNARTPIGLRSARVFGAVAAITLAMVGSVAGAAERARIAVVHVRDDEPSRRIRAELGAAGLEPVDVSVPSTDTRSAVQVAKAERAVAAIRVVSADEVEIAIVESESDKVLYGKVVRSSGAQSDSLPLRAVEDLRARLVKLRLVEPTPGEETPLPAEKSPPPSAPPERDDGARASASAQIRSLWVTGAFGATASTGGLGGDIVARLGLRLDATRRFGGSASVLLPLAAQTVSGSEGHAEANVYTVGALFHYAPVVQGDWGADLGIGAGVVIAKMQGFADSAGFAGRSETLVAGTPLANASLAYRPISMLRVRGELLLGVAIPRLAVTFDERDVAVWGRPFMAALLGLEVALSAEREHEASQ